MQLNISKFLSRSFVNQGNTLQYLNREVNQSPVHKLRTIRRFCETLKDPVDRFTKRGEIERLFGRLSHCLRRNPKNFIKPKKRCIVRGRTIALGVGTLLTCGQLRFATASCRAGTGRDSPTSRLLEKTIEDTSGQSEFDIWLFLKFLRPDLFLILLSVVSAIAVAFINVQVPVYLGDLVQVVSHFSREYAGDYIQEIKTPALKLVSAYSLQAIGTACYISLLGVVGERLATRMRISLFAALLKQDVTFFDTSRTGELVNRLSGDVQEFKRSFKLCISQGLRGLTQIAGSSVSLYLLSPRLAIVLFGTVPVVIILGACCGALLRKLSQSAQDQVSRAMSVADEALANIRTVRAFAMEQQEGALFEEELKKAERLNSVLGCGIGFFQGFSNLFLNGLVLGVVYCGGYLMSSGQLQAGQLMSFLVAAQSIQRSVSVMSILFGQAIRGVSAGGRAFEFIKLEPEVPLTGGITIPYHSLYANVDFSDVHFSYPTRPEQKILDGFSLSLPRGQVVAICGPSGAGKSTVAALLERFYDVSEGSITVDGVSIKDLDPSWLRGQTIGYINQEPTLFATSVMENIRYGKAGASDVEVMEAAAAASAHEFIIEFPEGYQTVLGERGVTVSGGQKQRIAIARALLKDPSILILDEATSALDAESERLVQSALDRLSKGRTVLVIAHRLSTIRNAHVIAVLHEGKVQEIGSHDELVKKKGLYAELVKRQAEEHH
ncbi:mitochondrial potassium channel ATP-binding subunit-like isoform X2 [Apostichopus japonicus]|uniref:mitochondrial potassium channel ATP-binding subunit-like isoform X2 n=1 Tax=Stichopus japonicus TaxID=307972 RepID=UPI003AB456F1